MYCLNNQKGIALVVTLLVVALLTALVVEFAYGVYTGTNDLYNWRDAQRLSLMAKSGVNVSANFLSNATLLEPYTESVEMPVENPFEDFKGVITISIEDESSKFNINSLISPGGALNNTAYSAFKNLLKILSLDEQIGARVADWIDKDSEAILSDSEAGAKNAAFNSVDELLLIHGISRKDYDTLLPYVTIFGTRDNLSINVNRVKKPVLRCIAQGIDEGLAQRVIDKRKIKPFKSGGDFTGMLEPITIPSDIQLEIAGTIFSIHSTASSGGVKRIIETVLDTSNNTIQYWKEY